jgi:hypothetical protein
MSKKPFIGAIVHYIEIEGHDLDGNPIRTCHAAIVTRLPDSYANPGKVDMTAIIDNSLRSESRTMHDSGNEEMTWHWPEECLLNRKESEEDGKRQ